MLVVEGLLEPRDNSRNWTVPKRCIRLILPVGVRCVKNGFIPVESFLHTAARLGVRGFLLCNFIQRTCYDVLRIPKLSNPLVGNSCHRTAAWRPPVGRQNRLPNNQHAHLPLRVPSQELLSCGGPPADNPVTWEKGEAPVEEHRSQRQRHSRSR